MRETIKSLVREKDICVLATVSNSAPYCSLMAYAPDEECTQVYMATLENTKKYANLRKNPQVSLLVDTRDQDTGPRREQAKALTIEGVFEPIQDRTKGDEVRGLLLQRHPHMKAFLEHPECVVFSVKVLSFLLLEGLTKAHFERLP